MTSSQSSPEMPAPAAMVDALLLVAEQSFFSDAVICEPPDFAERHAALLAAEPGAIARWLSAGVSFRGELSGAVEIDVPEVLARHLLASFAGSADDGADVPDAQLMDVAGELANMIAGRWLTAACAGRPFELVPPHVMWRSGPGDTAPAPGRDVLLACIDDLPMLVRTVTE